MPEVTTLKIKSNSSADLLNAIRNTASQNYREYVPYANNADSVKKIGNILMDYVPLQNEFINALVNRIMAVWIESVDYENPWAFFSKGELELGETIEQVWIDLIKPHQFDPALAETEIFKRENPNVYSAFHYINSKLFYKLTIEHEQLRAAFQTWNGLRDFTARLVKSMATSEASDEFDIMRAVVARHILNGDFYPVSVPTITEDNMRSITSVIKGVSNDMTFMSRVYNPAGVSNKSFKDDQYLIVTGAFDAAMDVNVLATSFNMDKAEFMGHRVLTPTFSRQDNVRLAQLIPDFTPFTDAELTALAAVPGVLVDRSWFVYVTTLREMRDMPNGQGLSWQYWYHVWKVYSMSPFANAVVFVPGTPSISAVSVSPSTVSAYPGTSIQVAANVTTQFFASKAVNWSSSNESVATVDRRGIVTINADAVAGQTVTITATSVFDSTKTATCTLTVDGGSVTPTISVSPTSLTFGDSTTPISDTTTHTATLSGTSIAYAVKTVTLTDAADTNVSSSVSVSISGNTVNVSINPTGFADGDFEGSVVITGVSSTGGVADVTLAVSGRFQGL